VCYNVDTGRERRKTPQNPSAIASVQPSATVLGSPQRYGNRSPRERCKTGQRGKRAASNNSMRVRAPNAVGCVSLKELKSLKKLLTKPQKCAIIKIQQGEGEATREERAAPREAVRPLPTTPTARSLGVRYISSPQAGGAETRRKPGRRQNPSGRDTDSLTGIFFVQMGPLFEPADPGRSLGKRPEFGASNSGDNFVTNRLQIGNKLLHPEKLQNSHKAVTE